MNWLRSLDKDFFYFIFHIMKRLFPVLILFLLFTSCRKSESDFIWEKSYGGGKAYFIKSLPDSGFISAGETGGTPYLLRFNKKRNLVLEYKSENPGLFSSVWLDTSGYIAAGNSAGKLLLMRLSTTGRKLWEKSIDGGFNIDYTMLHYSGADGLLAISAARADSSVSGVTGILFVRFDTTGQIITQKKITDDSFIAAADATVDEAGNIYLALTRIVTGTKPKASVAKFNDQFQKLWETDIYNNPDFGAASNAIIADASGNVYVAGYTGVATKDGNINNSFIISVSVNGSLNWKRYLESTNDGSALVFNSANDIMLLNKNCFIINIINTADGTDAGRIKTFGLCVSGSTDAFGMDMDINYDKNILMSGSRGGSFYLALKASQ
jgi:hypothetical protein